MRSGYQNEQIEIFTLSKEGNLSVINSQDEVIFELINPLSKFKVDL
jgi:hypothetical protein